jgi:hypothetical protein
MVIHGSVTISVDSRSERGLHPPRGSGSFDRFGQAWSPGTRMLSSP